MKPNLFHRLTALTLLAALPGTLSPVPLLAQVAASAGPFEIVTERPLSLPATGPQPSAKLLAEQERMLAAPVLEPPSGPPIEPRPLVQLPMFPKFSDPPVDTEIAMIQVFDDAPVPFGREKPGENAAFIRTLETWVKTPQHRRDFAILEDFLKAQHGSRWEVAIGGKWPGL